MPPRGTWYTSATGATLRRDDGERSAAQRRLGVLFCVFKNIITPLFCNGLCDLGKGAGTFYSSTLSCVHSWIWVYDLRHECR